MSLKLSILAGAIAALGCHSAFALDLGERVKLRGFGTIGVTHATLDEQDFVSQSMQPTGTGKTRDFDPGTDTKIGGQLDASLTSSLSAVVQVTSQKRYDASWQPEVDWANLKFQATPNVAFRIGRMGTPAYLVSDYRKVGYSYTWARPPVEVYFPNPLLSYDGADVTYRHEFGDTSMTLQGFGGRSRLKASDEVYADISPMFGANATVEHGAFSVRGAAIRSKLTITSGADQIFAGYRQLATALNGFGLSTEAARANEIADKYEAKDKTATFLSLGATYDPGSWLLTGELIRVRTNSFSADSTAAYVTGGMRFGKFTPYVTYARQYIDNETSEAGVDLPASAALDAGLNSALATGNTAQHTTSVGVRWDFMSNVDAKLQFDHVKHDGNSYGSLKGYAAGVAPSVKRYNVLTATVDYIF